MHAAIGLALVSRGDCEACRVLADRSDESPGDDWLCEAWLVARVVGVHYSLEQESRRKYGWGYRFDPG